MNALILNGSLGGGDGLDQLERAVVGALGQWAVQSILLRDVTIAHCAGCFGCWVKTPGECVIPDAGRDIANAFVKSDLVVFLTPVTFGGYSSELKKALDRALPIILPFFMEIHGEVHHRPRYARYPRLISLGVLARPDGESERIFTTLLSRNAINFHSPGHAARVLSLDSERDERERAIDAALGEAGVAP